MKHRTLKTMLAAVLILCTLLPLPAANAKTKYTVEVKKTEVEADMVLNTDGYASLIKGYNHSEKDNQNAYNMISEYCLYGNQTVEDFLKDYHFDSIEDYCKELFPGYHGLMDSEGSVIMPYILSENLYYVSDGIISKGNWYNVSSRLDKETDGYFDLKGNRILNDKYEFSGMFNEGITFIRHSATDDMYADPSDWYKTLLIDKNGKTILELPKTVSNVIGLGDSLSSLFFNDFPVYLSPVFSEGLLSFSSSIPFKNSVFEEATISANGYRTGYMDLSGNIVIPLQFASAESFSNGLACVQEYIEPVNNPGSTDIVQNGKCGYINKEGELVIPYLYDSISNFDGEYAAVKKDGKYGLINTKGETVIPFEYAYMVINDGIITCSTDTDTSPLILMTVDKEIIWQIDAQNLDYSSDYDDGVLYYVKFNELHFLSVYFFYFLAIPKVCSIEQKEHY